MKEIYNSQKTYGRKDASPKGAEHSFLFWLILPVLLVWFSFSYVLGFIREKPLWTPSENPQSPAANIPPYIAAYEPVSVSKSQGFITLWFDDAWSSQYFNAYPELKSLGYPGVVAVPTASIEKPNYMNWAQLRVLQNEGWEITDHGQVHDCQMQNWDSTKVIQEYKNSKLTLWKNKLSADIFVTPCGVDSDLMRDEARRYFLGYRTVNPGFNDLSNLDFYDLKVKNIDQEVSFETIEEWIDYAKETKSWLILVFHRIEEKSSGEVDDNYNTPLNDFKGILEYIKSAGITVVVPSQILALTII